MRNSFVLALMAGALLMLSACAVEATKQQDNPLLMAGTGAGMLATQAGVTGATAGTMASATGGMDVATAGTQAPIAGSAGTTAGTESTSGGAGGDTGTDAGDMNACANGAQDAGAACPCMPGDASCDGEEDPEEDPATLCIVQPITEEVRAIHGDIFTRFASARGVPVLATDSPEDESLRRACMLVRDLSQRPEILQTMLDETIGLVLMGVDETSADFPEFAAWGVPDSRARGLGGVPRGLCAEENVMCDRSVDRWRGESICVHEFSHTMHLGVYNVMDDTFDDRVSAAFRSARNAGKYSSTYAASNAVEYFAEGVQDWYNTNIESIPPNGVHNEINTRAELEEYDPELYEILASVLPDEPGYEDCYIYE